MINPGLHLQAYTPGDGVKSKVGPMIDGIRSPLLPLNARVLANCCVISAPVTSVGLIFCSVIVRNTTALVSGITGQLTDINAVTTASSREGSVWSNWTAIPSYDPLFNKVGLSDYYNGSSLATLLRVSFLLDVQTDKQWVREPAFKHIPGSHGYNVQHNRCSLAKKHKFKLFLVYSTAQCVVSVSSKGLLSIKLLSTKHHRFILDSMSDTSLNSAPPENISLHDLQTTLAKAFAAMVWYRAFAFSLQALCSDAPWLIYSLSIRKEYE